MYFNIYIKGKDSKPVIVGNYTIGNTDTDISTKNYDSNSKTLLKTSGQLADVDAVIVAGDFTGGGAEKEYEIYNKIVAENKKDETQLLTILGNHELR